MTFWVHRISIVHDFPSYESAIEDEHFSQGVATLDELGGSSESDAK
jgi:hypothetical protein